jgi:hypothetical protein
VAPIIAEVLEMAAACPGMDERHLQLELRTAWDIAGFGPRKHWPYKVWRDEIARQRGLRRGRMTPPKSTAQPEWYQQKVLEAAGQQTLFDMEDTHGNAS